MMGLDDPRIVLDVLDGALRVACALVAAIAFASAAWFLLAT